jgi:putative SOS response-associated peptidase YedK
MCGRFAQYSSRGEYFDALCLTQDEITLDPEPISRFNAAPGTRVLLLIGSRPEMLNRIKA